MNEQAIETTTQKKVKGINQFSLKIFAIIIMTIDHVSACILTRILIQRGMLDSSGITFEWYQENKKLYLIMIAMRYIGRLAFPLFCYFIVEGFSKTHDKKKYALNLAIFGLISEIPFDLAVNGKLMDWSYQSVYVTLLIGLLGIWGLSIVEERITNKGLSILARLGVVGVAFGLGIITECDYKGMGVLTILVMYTLRKYPVVSFTAGVCVLVLSNLMEITAFIDVILIAFYNHERGPVKGNSKYGFYLFYPVHLFIIWLVCYFMGMGFISALSN